MKYIGFPRPSYPLAVILERTYWGTCNVLAKRKKTASEVVQW